MHNIYMHTPDMHKDEHIMYTHAHIKQVSTFKGIPSLDKLLDKEASLSGKQLELLQWILSPKPFTLHCRSLSVVSS